MTQTYGSAHVLDTLDKAFKNDKAMVPENLFIKYLLPSLASTTEENTDLSMWLELAGTYTRDIAVVDTKDNSKILFEIPALVARHELQKGADNTNIDGIVGDVRKRAEVSQQAAGQYLGNQLSDLIQVSGNREENIRKWNVMWERYGYADRIIQLDTSNSDNTKQVKTDNGLEEVGFEDF